jgi:hypothetical protein
MPLLSQKTVNRENVKKQREGEEAEVEKLNKKKKAVEEKKKKEEEKARDKTSRNWHCELSVSGPGTSRLQIANRGCLHGLVRVKPFSPNTSGLPCGQHLRPLRDDWD